MAIILYAAIFVAAYLLYQRSRSAALFALFATEPFAFPLHIFATTVTLPKVVLLATATGILLDAVRGRYSARPGPSRVVFAACVALVFATAISILQAANFGDAARETFKSIEYALLVFVAWYLASTASTQMVFKTLPWLLAAVCGTALFDLYSGYKSVLIVDGVILPRVAGVLEGPNQLGGWIALLFPFVLVLATVAKTRYDRYVNAGAVFVGVATAILTFSRASAVSITMEWICVIALVRSRAHVRVAGIILLAVIATFSINARSAHSMLTYFSSSTQETNTGGVGTRSMLWTAAIALWAQHPVLGIGAGNFEDSLPLAHVTNVKTHANNVYLQAAVEGGLPLLVTTFALLIAPLFLFFRLAWRSSTLAAACAAACGFAVHGLLDDLWFFPKVATIWCLFIGVAAARADSLRRRGDAPGVPSWRLQIESVLASFKSKAATRPSLLTSGQINAPPSGWTSEHRADRAMTVDSSESAFVQTVRTENPTRFTHSVENREGETRVGKISVILPAYNESRFILKNVLETVETLRSFHYDFEVIVVDDGSPDKTHLSALGAKAVAPDVVRVVRYDQNRGKGHALLCGASYACGDLIVFLDADMDLHPSQLPVLLELMKLNDADVVIGSKLHPLSKVNYPRSRRILSLGYYAIVRVLFGLPVRDTQTGIKVFRAEVLQRISTLSRAHKFAFDLELLCLAHLFGYRLIDAPVTLEFRRGTFGRIRLKDIVTIFHDTINIFVRLRMFQRIVKDVAGLTVPTRLMGTEQALPTGHSGVAPSTEAEQATIAV